MPPNQSLYLKAFHEMNSTLLDILLTASGRYHEIAKDTIIFTFEEIFRKLKKAGDTYLEVYEGDYDCDGDCVERGKSGCTGTASLNIQIGTAPHVEAFVRENQVCEGTTFYLYATGDVKEYIWSGPWGYSFTGNPGIVINPSVYMSGTYTVTAVGPTGCTSTASVTVTVYPQVLGTISAVPNPVQSGGTLRLGATGGTIYDWSGPGGFSSSEQNPIVYRFGPKNVGTYSVIISNDGGCEDIQFIKVTMAAAKDGNNNMGEISQAKIVDGTIYPNPTNSYITLERSSNTAVQYTILDMSGKVIVKNGMSADGQVNVENLAPGAYNVLWMQPEVAGDAFRGHFVKVK